MNEMLRAMAARVRSVAPELRGALMPRVLALPMLSSSTLDQIQASLHPIRAARSPGLARDLSWMMISDGSSGTPMSSVVNVGFGQLASMANRDQYVRYTASMLLVCSSLEAALDKSSSPAVQHFWGPYGSALRRSEKLRSDLKEVDASPISAEMAGFETMCYIRVIENAARADEAEGSALLLGHAYSRYVPEVVAGSMYGLPMYMNRRALGLGDTSPSRYTFGKSFDAAKQDISSVESMLHILNEAGELAGSQSAREAIVAEARRALRAHVHVSNDLSGWLGLTSLVGVKRIALGHIKDIKSSSTPNTATLMSASPVPAPTEEQRKPREAPFGHSFDSSMQPKLPTMKAALRRGRERLPPQAHKIARVPGMF